MSTSQSNYGTSSGGSNSSGSSSGKGISRRKIVMSQSQLALNKIVDEDDDVWYDTATLFSHHLKEVLDKWTDIDDEIWGKVIYLERGRRVAKAYCRVPVLTINGSNQGFNGYCIGLNGFDNNKRHRSTVEVKKEIGEGFKMKMDQEGNVYLKKVTETPVSIKTTGNTLTADNCLPVDLLKQQGQLETSKPVKIFDMKRFTQNIAKELKSPYIDREKLELQCIVNIHFGTPEQTHLDSPCWLMLINIVALDMLRNQLPEEVYASSRPTNQKVGFQRAPAMMENVSAARYVSTPRDEHYPRLMKAQVNVDPAAMIVDPSLGQVNDYGTVGYARPRQGLQPGSMATLPLTNLYAAYQANQQILSQIPPELAAQFRQPLHSYQTGFMPLKSAKQFPADADAKRWSSFANLQSIPIQGTHKIADWE